MYKFRLISEQVLLKSKSSKEQSKAQKSKSTKEQRRKTAKEQNTKEKKHKRAKQRARPSTNAQKATDTVSRTAVDKTKDELTEFIDGLQIKESRFALVASIALDVGFTSAFSRHGVAGRIVVHGSPFVARTRTTT